MKPPFYMRYVILMAVCAILGVGIVFQMVRINYSSSAQELIEKSVSYQALKKPFTHPWTIYDRNGHVLATTDRYEVGIDLKFVTDPINRLSAASLLDLEYADVFSLASTLQNGEDENRYFVLASYVNEETVDELQALKDSYTERRRETGTSTPSLSGLIWTGMEQRSYPEDKLAANVLGFYNYFSRETAQGVYGLKKPITAC